MHNFESHAYVDKFYTYEIKCTILNRTHMLTNLKINVIIFKTMFQWEGKYKKLFCILISFDSTAHSRVHVLEYQLSYEPAE